MATRVSDPYETLGVSRDASTDEIRSAYRKLAREYHPDVNKEPGAEDRFKEVSQAYEVLRDPERRAEYDRGGRTGAPPGWEARQGGPAGGGFDDVRFDFGGGGGDFGDIFEGIFGRRGRAGPAGFDGFSTRGGDQEAVIELSLEEAARGGKRRITLADGRDYEVTVPRGVRDGQRIRLAGEGAPGVGGGPSGDLMLRVRLRRHPRFRLEGDDLYTDLPVTPWEAALGATVDVPTLTGTARVRVPPGSSSGRRLRLRGEGMPKQSGGAGDLYAVVSIKVPKELTAEERELFERLRDVSNFNPRSGGRS